MLVRQPASLECWCDICIMNIVQTACDIFYIGLITEAGHGPVYKSSVSNQFVRTSLITILMMSLPEVFTINQTENYH